MNDFSDFGIGSKTCTISELEERVLVRETALKVLNENYEMTQRKNRELEARVKELENQILLILEPLI